METTIDATPKETYNKETYNIEVTGSWGYRELLNVSEYTIDKDGYLIVPVPDNGTVLGRDHKYIFRNWGFVRIVLDETS